MIQNLMFGIPFLKNIISAIQLLHVRPHVPVGIIRVFF